MATGSEIPGQLPAFEAARARQIEHRREHDYPWNEFVSINENNLVRIGVVLDNGWVDMGARSAWFQEVPRGNSGMRDVVEFVGTEIGQPLPEDAYQPENPRVAQGEAGFIREVRIFPNPGSGNGVRELMGEVSEAFRENGSDQPRFVSRNIVGGGSFSLSVFYPAKDVSDYYAASEALQPIFDRLLPDRPAGEVRRIENTNWTTRSDLSYTPSN